MKILAVDDERLALSGLVRAIETACPDGEIFSYQNALEALEFTCQTTCEIAFLDVEMREMNGLQLAKRLKTINPNINIIFVTGYSQYAGEAMYMHASGYVMKPVNADDIIIEMENLRHPVVPLPGKRITVQTFGNFQAYVDGRTLKFARSKTTELFAYLVDRRGAAVNTEELCAILWEDEKKQSSQKAVLRTLIADLNNTLREFDVQDVFIKSRNSFAIDTTMIDCDYYRMLNNDVSAINTYRGEYMSQYSWAEFTIGRLERKGLDITT